MKQPRLPLDDRTRKTIGETFHRGLQAADRILRPQLVVPVFFALLLLVSLVSGAVVLKERRQAAQEAALTQPQTQPEPTAAQVSQELDADFLLVFSGNQNNRLKMLAVLHANSTDGTFSLYYVNPADRVNVNNLNGSMQQHYDKGGATELMWAVGTRVERTVDRYILVNDDRLTSFCKNLGEHELEIDRSVRGEQEGVAFAIESGMQKLTSDTLCKYFGSCCAELYSGEEGRVTNLLRYLIEKLLSGENAPRLDVILTRLIREAVTNISAMDLSTYQAVSDAFRTNDGTVKLTDNGIFVPEPQK